MKITIEKSSAPDFYVGEVTSTGSQVGDVKQLVVHGSLPVVIHAIIVHLQSLLRWNGSDEAL